VLGWVQFADATPPPSLPDHRGLWSDPRGVAWAWALLIGTLPEGSTTSYNVGAPVCPGAGSGNRVPPLLAPLNAKVIVISSKLGSWPCTSNFSPVVFLNTILFTLRSFYSTFFKRAIFCDPDFFLSLLPPNEHHSGVAGACRCPGATTPRDRRRPGGCWESSPRLTRPSGGGVWWVGLLSRVARSHYVTHPKTPTHTLTHSQPQPINHHRQTTTRAHPPTDTQTPHPYTYIPPLFCYDLSLRVRVSVSTINRIGLR